MAATVVHPRCIRLLRCLLVVLAAAVATAVPGRAAIAQEESADRGGGIGLRLVDVPVSAGPDPRARLYILDHLAPGTAIQRRIELSNTTDSTAHIALYAAAATVARGVFAGSDGHTDNEVSTWTTVTPGESDVPAGGRATATVSIRVPRDAAPGERYGVVWAEARSALPDDSGVTRVNRVGIRIYLSVGPGGPPAAAFTVGAPTAARSADGDPLVVAAVHNTGGRALDIGGTLLLLDGPGGLTAGPFPAALRTTLGTGETGAVSTTLDERLPAGPWDAVITLRSGLIERSERATITFPDTGTSPAGATAPNAGRRLDSAAVLLAAALAVGVVAVARRQHGRRAAVDLAGATWTIPATAGSDHHR